MTAYRELKVGSSGGGGMLYPILNIDAESTQIAEYF
jgi:hypothetical protein